MRSRKKSSGALKYFVLIIIVIVLVVSFKLTLKGREVKENPENNNQTPNSSQQENENQTKPDGTTIPDNTTKPDISNEKEDEISGGNETLPLSQYRFYDTYVIASEETKYFTSGYKYFIVGTYDTFLTYINTNMQSTLKENDVDNYTDINSTTLAGVKNAFTKEFFKTKYMLFVVDYSTSPISGTIDKIQNNEGEITVTIKRDTDAKDKSLYNTYLIPLETKDIDTVKIEYTK